MNHDKTIIDYKHKGTDKQSVEYKVIPSHIPHAENVLNTYAIDGWVLHTHVKEDEVFILERPVKQGFF